MKQISNKKPLQILLFGNELLEQDNLPIKLFDGLCRKFPEIDFVIKDPNENLWPIDGGLAIIDTAVGIKKVQTLTDISKIQPENSPCSLHDFDLALNLKLLEKIGKLKKVVIFAVPQGIKKEDALGQLTKSIGEYFSEATN